MREGKVLSFGSELFQDCKNMMSTRGVIIGPGRIWGNFGINHFIRTKEGICVKCLDVRIEGIIVFYMKEYNLVPSI